MFSLAARRLRTLLGRLGFDATAPWPYLLVSLLIRLPRHAEGLRVLAPYFPHIDLAHPRRADVLRIPLQVAWIALIRPPGAPGARNADTPATRGAYLASRAGLLLALADRHWLRLSTPVPRPPASRLESRLACRLETMGSYRRQSLLLPAAALVIAVAGMPLSATAQITFSAACLASLIPARRASGLLGSAASGLAVLLSARYFWWRFEDTLPAGSQVDLTLALCLVMAEAWMRIGGSLAHRAMPSRAADFWAQACLSLAPPLVLIAGIVLIDGTVTDLLLYALPHLVAWWLVDMEGNALHATRRGRQIAIAFGPNKVGAGVTVMASLGWANAFAMLAGIALLIDGGDRGMTMLFMAWTMLNLAYLGLAVEFGTRAADGDRWLAPSEALSLARSGLGLLARAPWTMPARWRQPRDRWLAAIGPWLPRMPIVAGHFAAGFIVLALLASPSMSLAEPAEQTRRLSMKMLTGQNAISLRNAESSASVYFGQRADELVTRARLRLRYTHSPALLPRDSHIKITLNDEVIGVAAIRKDAEGQALTEEFEIDPRFIADRNELRFRFVGHYAQTCEDPLRNSLWAEISGASEILVSHSSLVLQDDLSRLPEPFFDKRDLTGLTLPIVFAASPGLPTLTAAGIVTSWFGDLAGERGARFPVQTERPPPGHGIVVATNGERPAFLRGRPQVDGPTLEMITNPTDGVSKLLLVLGRDGIDLAEAARALVLGHVAMSGQKVTLRSRRETKPRPAYDAPNWARSDRPTRLGELIAFPQQLQATGHAPPPVKVDLRVAPDIFSVGRRGIPATMRYRYSPPARGGENLLNMSLNDQLVHSWTLAPQPDGLGISSRLARKGTPLIAEEHRLSLPAQRIRGRNRLAFSFAFARHQEGPCPDIPPDDTRQALIDPESTVDFSRHYHFARMPNLNHFASAGFPFTKFADLSQTVVVMPEKPSREEIEAAMNLLGHFGRSTGVPGSQVRIVGPGEESLLRDADLLVIGSAMGQGVLAQWPDYVPADISGDIRRISQPVRTINFLYDWLGFTVDPDEAIASQDKFSAEGPLALIAGFRSPLDTTRSVVAITASAPDQLWQATNAIADEKLAAGIHGSIAFVRGTQIHSFRVGESYFVGELPWWVMIWFPLSAHPLLLALLTVVSVVLLTAAWMRWRKQRAIGGNQGDEEND